MAEMVFQRTKGLQDRPFITVRAAPTAIHRLVAEALGTGCSGQGDGVAPVGCSVFAYDYFNCDMQEAAHGRALPLPPV